MIPIPKKLEFIDPLEIFNELAAKNKPQEAQEIIPLVEWVQKYRTIRGEPFSFDNGHEYLRAIYEDTCPKIDVMKSAQCGASEWMISTGFFYADVHRATVIYVFPKGQQLNDFSRERVDTAIRESPYLKSIVGEIDNVGLKKIRNAFFYFRGSQNYDQITSIAGDVLLLDEVDRMVQSNIPVAEKRLGHSNLKIQRGISTPSIPEYGIHARFLEGDQREYFQPCSHCGEKQVLTWEKNINEQLALQRIREAGGWQGVTDESGLCFCAKCGKDFDRLVLGEWVPKEPGRIAHSYHISKLFSPRATICELADNKNKPNGEQEFYWSDLGLPFVAKGDQLDDEILNACPRGDHMPSVHIGPCAMGVDVGKGLHVRISYYLSDGRKIPMYIGCVEHFEQLDQLMIRYNVQSCVVDMFPETREAKKFQARHRSKVWLAEYQLKDPTKIYDFDDSHPEGPRVNINRTMALDETFARFIERRIILPPNAREIPDYYDHLKAQVRVKKKNEKTGNYEYVYVQQENKPDHYAHAELYEEIAAKRRGARAGSLTYY